LRVRALARRPPEPSTHTYSAIQDESEGVNFLRSSIIDMVGVATRVGRTDARRGAPTREDRAGEVARRERPGAAPPTNAGMVECMA
jgi:hypothetical protein